MEHGFDYFVTKLNQVLRSDPTTRIDAGSYSVGKYDLTPRGIDRIRDLLKRAAELPEEEQRALVRSQISSCFTSSFLYHLREAFSERAKRHFSGLKEQHARMADMTARYPAGENLTVVAQFLTNLTGYFTGANVPLQELVDRAVEHASGVLFDVRNTWEIRDQIANETGVSVRPRRRKLHLYAIVALSAQDAPLDISEIAKLTDRCAQKETERVGKPKFAKMKPQNFRSYLSRWRARAAELKQAIPPDAYLPYR